MNCARRVAHLGGNGIEFPSPSLAVRFCAIDRQIAGRPAPATVHRRKLERGCGHDVVIYVRRHMAKSSVLWLCVRVAIDRGQASTRDKRRCSCLRNASLCAALLVLYHIL